MSEGRESDEDNRNAIKVAVLPSIDAVSRDDWDACAGRDNPFVSFDFLDALEASGSVRAETGWAPQHLAVLTDDGRLLACAPLYLKGHSYGEYVFDHSWAAAYGHAGGNYYPKLQCAVPFTPVAGPRILIRPDRWPDDPDDDVLFGAIVSAMAQICARHEASSLHITFCIEEEWRKFGALGLLQRRDRQFHWRNDGYRNFEDFLNALSSRKRKNIRKERAAARDSGVCLSPLRGAEIKPRHWDAFFDFYIDTSDRKWGSPYLNRAFFHLLGERMADRIVLVFGESFGEPICGALNIIGGDTLYGRNWGCSARFKFLHFETCYYQAIDYAIAEGLRTVEAGAQGPHKIQRGYLPVPTYSAHLIRDASFRRAIADYLARERPHVDFEMEALADHSPFRRPTD